MSKKIQIVLAVSVLVFAIAAQTADAQNVSFGSGSLIIVMLMLLYPKLSSKEMVGTDLVQAIPLVGAAALGHYFFGDPKLDLILSVLIGAIPAVMVGAHFSSKASDTYIRPILFSVLAISALKLLEPKKNQFNTLVLVLGGLAVVGISGYALYRRRLGLDVAQAEGQQTPQLAA